MLDSNPSPATSSLCGPGQVTKPLRDPLIWKTGITVLVLLHGGRFNKATLLTQSEAASRCITRMGTSFVWPTPYQHFLWVTSSLSSGLFGAWSPSLKMMGLIRKTVEEGNIQWRKTVLV